MPTDRTAPAPAAGGLSITLRRTFEAPRERVFAALTRAEELKRWFGPADQRPSLVEVDARPGGRYRIHKRMLDGTESSLSGVFREVVPPERLVYTWTWDWAPAVETLVTIELHDRAGRTELVLTHTGLPDPDFATRHERGWDASLGQLATIL